MMEPREKTIEEWAREAEELSARLAEVEETLRAIREGEVDSLIISTPEGERVYTLEGADHPYRILVESMQQGAATLLVDGSIFYSNQYLAGMLKTPLQQLIGASIKDFVHPDDAPLFDALFEQARQQSSEGELRFLSAKDATIPVYLAFNRMHLGERTGICLAVTDLTTSVAAKQLAQANEQLTQEVAERKRVEEALKKAHLELETRVQERTIELKKANETAAAERQRFNDVLQMMPAYVILLAPDYHVPFANRFFEERFGKSMGKRCHEFLFNRAEPCETCETFKVLSTNTPHHWQWTGPDGRNYDIHDFPFTDVDGSPLIMEVGIDITERVRAEATLKIANETLEQRVAERTAALYAANDRLTEADRRKDEFLAMLAHELRNPLAPIRNAVQILHLVGTNEKALQRQRSIIERQVTHMARLLGDLLDVSRITQGKIELKRQPLHLTDVLAHAIETTSPIIEARRHTFHVTLPPDDLRVEGDLDRLAQIFGNLLVNAAKYTIEGGQIWLDAAREGAEAVVRVRDTGEGIAPEMLPRIFDLFTQADQSLARTQGGLGIGLTMVKNLTRMHGGHVEAHSAGIGQGSEFIVRIPALSLDRPEPMEVEPVRAVPENASHRRILVVDDVVDSAESLVELLRIWGHEAIAAYDGSAVLSLVRNFSPEVVLLDIGLPGMDGFEVARQLRQNNHGRPLLLVALTGYAQESDREEARAAGFDSHLAKPVDLNALREILSRPVVV